MECLSELKKDFKESLGCIDFKRYNPNSVLFQRALYVGEMYLAVKSLESDVDEELDGAKAYFDEYKTTGDPVYMEMANDELRHAGILIKKHLAKEADEKKRKWLNSMEEKRQKMLKEFSPPKTSV